jgi:hypothetical protein
MSLLLILRKIWKYKLATLPIFALILAGAVYVIAVAAPTYEAGSTYILVAPPPPPTDDQIARNPALGRINPDNPYTRYSDQSVLVQILASRLNSDETRRSLAKQGADPNYTVAPSAEFGFSAPIMQITGTGTTAAGAINTAHLVGQGLVRELDRMQRERKVDELYRIKTEAVVTAHDATLKASGKLRSLVAVLALGGILLFIVISVLDALSALRAEWRQGLVVDDDLVVDGSYLPPLTLAPDPTYNSDSDPDPDAPPWPIEAKR